MDFFSDNYKTKRASYKQFKVTIDQLNDDVIIEFYKCITKDMIDELEKIIETNGIEKYKAKIKEFRVNYEQEYLDDSDFSFIEKMFSIYGVEIIKSSSILEE